MRLITGLDVLDAAEKLLIDVPGSTVYGAVFPEMNCEYVLGLDSETTPRAQAVLHPQAQMGQLVSACIVGNMMDRTWGVPLQLMSDHWVSLDAPGLAGWSIDGSPSMVYSGTVERGEGTVDWPRLAHEFATNSLVRVENGSAPLSLADLDMDTDAVRIMAAMQCVQDHEWSWDHAVEFGIMVAEQLGIRR